MKIMIRGVKSLDITRNNLLSLPQTIGNVNGTIRLRISNNPYECTCDTLWMKNWLMNTKNVVDKDNVTCSTSEVKGMYWLIELLLQIFTLFIRR